MVLTCQAMLLLAAQYQQLNEPHLKPLTTQQPLLHRCIGLQGLLDDLIAAAVQRVCAEFDPNDVDSLVSLHVLNVQSGAEMPELIRDAYLALVSSSDQFSSSAHPPCALQTALYREAQKDAQARPSDAPHGSDLSLAALFKAIPALKFRARAEWLMQTQFEWLQSFHAMQLHVQDELAAVRCMLASLSEGAEAIVDWSSGLPRVTVSGEEASLGAAQGRPDGSSTPGAPMSPQWQARPGEEPEEARALSPAAVAGAVDVASPGSPRGAGVDAEQETSTVREDACEAAAVNGHAGYDAAADAKFAPENAGAPGAGGDRGIVPDTVNGAAGNPGKSGTEENGCRDGGSARRGVGAVDGQVGGCGEVGVDAGCSTAQGSAQQAVEVVRLRVRISDDSIAEVNLLVQPGRTSRAGDVGEGMGGGDPGAAAAAEEARGTRGDDVGSMHDDQVDAGAEAARGGLVGADKGGGQQCAMHALAERGTGGGEDTEVVAGAAEGVSRVITEREPEHSDGAGTAAGGALPALPEERSVHLSDADLGSMENGVNRHGSVFGGDSVGRSDDRRVGVTPTEAAGATCDGALQAGESVGPVRIPSVASGADVRPGSQAGSDAPMSERSESLRAHMHVNGAMNGFAQAPSQAGAPVRLGRADGSSSGAVSLAGTSTGGPRRAGSAASASQAAVQAHGSIGSLVGKPQSVEDYLKQRERILHGVRRSWGVVRSVSC